MADQSVPSLSLTTTADAVVANPVDVAEVERGDLWRAQLGDPRAFARLMERHEPRLRAFVSRMSGGNPAIVDDMMQDTYLRVFRSLPSFLLGGPARFSTWLFTIAARVVIDERRSAWSRLVGHDEIDEVVDRRSGPFAEVEARQLRRRVDRALLDVSEALRAAFVLRVFCELSEAETAAALRIDVGTVKSRVSRVRAHIRRALDGGGSQW